MILMNIVLNVQAAWTAHQQSGLDGLTSRYTSGSHSTKPSPTRLRTKHFVEGGTETLPAHISQLQRLREACAG